jgi:UDP-N-acetylglucosamine--N-acetylmuramyl-(pentapeptide) pyrophosphoryl-undecaprenol N-acetylglucosamine transferase
MTTEADNRKILIMAGGTGGHVFPALSIAEYLLSRGIQVEWLGTRSGLEASVIPAANIPLHFISIAGLRGSSLGRRLLSPFVILVAVLQSLLKVAQIKPGCVLGMGGFVTGPGGLAAWLLRKKLLIHEQNAVAGLSNQLLFPFASTVMEAFPGAFQRKQDMTSNRLLKKFIRPGNTIVVGNPVRHDIAALSEQPFENTEGRRLRVLVIGGSLGAVAINKVIPAMLKLVPENERPEVLHQCGKRNVEKTRELYGIQEISLDGQIRVEPFIDDMQAAYRWADIIIARAGAMTIAEIAAVGMASILIPYPYAVDDHQTENAGYLRRTGAAEIIPQDELDEHRLLAALRKFSDDRAALLEAARNARQAGAPDATAKAAALCMEACYA